MTKHHLTLAIFMLLLLAAPALAAQAAAEVPFGLDPAVLAAIAAAMATFAFAQLLKIWLKQETWPEPWKTIGAYGITLIVAAGATAFVLVKSGAFTLTAFGLYTIASWGIANGWWKGITAIMDKALKRNQ